MTKIEVLLPCTDAQTQHNHVLGFLKTNHVSTRKGIFCDLVPFFVINCMDATCKYILFCVLYLLTEFCLSYHPHVL
jgi:hypothetical protein